MTRLLAAALALCCTAVAAQDEAMRDLPPVVPLQEVQAPDAQAVQTQVEALPSQQPEREVGRGLASWYGPRFHGRRTASGEKFDMHQYTAAHRTLPFGTIVHVRSLVNGRTIQVRINDRGPFIRKRVIDLSRAAAEALGLIDARTGTKPVVISVPRDND